MNTTNTNSAVPTIKFDGNGNKIYEKHPIYGEGYAVYEYDRNNNKIYEKLPNGTESRWINRYDDHANKIYEKYICDGVDTTICEYYYDSNDCLIYEKYTNLANDRVGEYVYDCHGKYHSTQY